MVFIVLAIHPLLNYFIGITSFSVSGVISFKVTKHILYVRDKENSQNNYLPEMKKKYKNVTYHREIIIEDELPDSKIKFHDIVRFTRIPNNEELSKNKDQLWYNSNDYTRFRNEEIERREEINLQDLMRQKEENDHLNNMLDKMQQKELETEKKRSDVN